MKRFIFFGLIILFTQTAKAQGILATVCGNDTIGFSGDGGPALAAKTKAALGICTDAEGNVYFADYNNNRVRKIDRSGIINTIAGTGLPEHSGDGGLATLADIGGPSFVFVDKDKNIYITDTSYSRVRKIDKLGIITTIAGTGERGFSGDGGLAINAKLNQPGYVIQDKDGNMIIEDRYNNRLRKINSAGIITTIAGNGVAGFSGDGGPAVSAQISPIGIAMDTGGRIIIVDAVNNRIRRIDRSGIITTIAGSGVAGYTGDGGKATMATLNYPYYPCVDQYNNIYFQSLRRIRKISDSGIISTIAGTGTPGYGGEGVPSLGSNIAPTVLAFDQLGMSFIFQRTAEYGK